MSALWQPIEAAPKDSEIFGCIYGAQVPVIMLWSEKAGGWIRTDVPSGFLFSPTHWMPLIRPVGFDLDS